MPAFSSLRCALFAALLTFNTLGAGAATDTDARALHAALAAERARPPAPAFERAAFLARPSVSEVTLSPDGRQLAWLREEGGQRGLWAQGVDDAAPRRLLGQTDARALAWTRDGRWLLLESRRQLAALAMAGQEGSGIVTPLGGSEMRRFDNVDPSQPAAVLLLAQQPAGEGAAAQWQWLRVPVGGEPQVLWRDTRRLTGLALDAAGRPAFVQHLDGEALVTRRIVANGEPQEVLRCTQLQRCGLLPATTPAGELLLRTDAAGSLRSLQRLDAQGRLHAMHGDPRGEADLDELVLDPRDARPLAAAYRSTVPALHGLDDEMRGRVAQLARHWPGRSLSLQVGRGPDARWLVGESDATLQATRWHLFDPASGRHRLVLDGALGDARGGAARPALPAAALARRIALSHRASDGMRLHGFLSVPPGADPARVPLVALVHGGPWNHARPGWSGLAQLLANRGIAVFEPNFRGSTGHGRSYTFAAQGDYGNGRVQRDIVEGVRWLLAQGVGDARRVGIAGASFGGYSALLGATFEPALFQVGIALVPPPDFAWALQSLRGTAEAESLSRVIPFEDWLRLLSLDPRDEARMAQLRAQSPRANAAALQRPVLLMAGAEDKRVGIGGVLDYAAQLKLLGKPVSLLVDPRAGHRTDDPVAREATYYLIERMLQRHLGSAAPTAPDAEVLAHIERCLAMDSSGLGVEPAR